MVDDLKFNTGVLIKALFHPAWLITFTLWVLVGKNRVYPEADVPTEIEGHVLKRRYRNMIIFEVSWDF